jgi:hypothetical protein
MKQLKYPVALICALMALPGTHCKEVFEKSLDKTNVVLSAPVDNLVSDSAAQTFYWQPIDSGINYELQIVSPRFDSIVRFLADTTMLTTVFPFSLTAGQYQWRVRAFNSSSTTVFCVPRSLTIF